MSKIGINYAVEYARAILDTESAINKTESEKAKRDYRLSAHRQREELLYYCTCNSLSIKEVFRMANGIK